MKKTIFWSTTISLVTTLAIIVSCSHEPTAGDHIFTPKDSEMTFQTKD